MRDKGLSRDCGSACDCCSSTRSGSAPHAASTTASSATARRGQICMPFRCASSERKHVSLDAGIEKLDLEQPIHNGLGLSDELVEPLLRHRAVALFVHVPAASIARRLTVNEHAESYRRSSGERSHDQMQIARVKPIDDASVRFIEGYEAGGYRPIATERPLIEPQRRRRSVG